ncbi:hypothetical protein ACWG0P_14060 [Amedibacillus sp. YH-ame6]
MIKVFPFTVNGIIQMRKYLGYMAQNMPTVKKRFVEQSLIWIKERANENIANTTGNSEWYVLTHQLENSWVTNIAKGTLVNICRYAGFIEYGTGIVGAGTHPDSGSYQYDSNGHGEQGWFFFGDDGELHWTQGMEAHSFLYNAIIDYYYGGESIRIFHDVMNTLIGGGVS